MRTVKLKMVAFVLFITAGFMACDKDDDVTPLITKMTFVTHVSGPTTASVNEEVAVNITFKVENKCGSFSKIIKETTDNVTVIEVEAEYLDTDCGETPSTKKVIYKFKEATAGTYIIKFKKSDTEFITHTIVVS